MSKPKVTVRRANTFVVPPQDYETIVEFSYPDGTGGLISFSETANGAPRIELYRCDAGIHVVLDALTDHSGGKLLAASDMSLAKIGITK